MHAADRTNHKNEIIFLEVPEPERIIFQDLDPVRNCLLTMVFAEESGKTRLTRHQRFESTAHSDQATPLLMKANE